MKNKLSTAQSVSAEFFIYYESGIDTLRDTLETSIAAGVVERPNNSAYVFKELKVTGRDKFIETIKADPDMLADLIDQTRKSLANLTQIVEDVNLDEDMKALEQLEMEVDYDK